jgi:hypothetical protein
MKLQNSTRLRKAENPGENSLDRQRIKRKAERSVKRFASMPKEERSFILSALLKKYRP